MKAVSKEPLTGDLEGYRDKVDTIARRGKQVIALMQVEHYPIERINKEKELLRREVTDARMTALQAYSGRLQKIESDSGIP
ncbi:MAG: hypothetical protein WC379_12585 [Methanoregula sp.]|jgi:hypothetical protein